NEARQNVPPEQVRVVEGAGIDLVPRRKRPLAGCDGRATPSPDLGRLRWVGGDAPFAADVARVGDSSSAVGTGPQRQSDRLNRWALEDPAGSRTSGCLDLARLHDRL